MLPNWTKPSQGSCPAVTVRKGLGHRPWHEQSQQWTGLHRLTQLHGCTPTLRGRRRSPAGEKMEGSQRRAPMTEGSLQRRPVLMSSPLPITASPPYHSLASIARPSSSATPPSFPPSSHASCRLRRSLPPSVSMLSSPPPMASGNAAPAVVRTPKGLYQWALGSLAGQGSADVG